MANASDETSCSSSLTELSDDFFDQLKTYMDNKGLSTDYYMKSAKDHLEEMARHSIQKLTLFGSGDIDPHSILAAMLEHAPKGGQRYTACAIISCAGDIAIQVNLANTWLCYFLLPILATSLHRSHDSTEEATPSPGETQEGLNSIRASDFRAQVMHRDGFQCVMTGLYDWHCKPELQPRIDLEAAHIVRCPVAIFNKQETPAATMTWEIIRQYTNWSIETMAKMIGFPDMAANGFMLDMNFCSSWDRFDWTLAPKADNKGLIIPNTYNIQVLKRLNFPTHIPSHDTITFRDHSVTDEDHMDEQYRKQFPKPRSGVSLPNPEFIEFHHAIANVLHMSGAAHAIKLPMDWLDYRRSPVKAMDTPELMLRLSGLQLMDRIYS